jgi:hypothetical protein
MILFPYSGLILINFPNAGKINLNNLIVNSVNPVFAGF